MVSKRVSDGFFGFYSLGQNGPPYKSVDFSFPIPPLSLFFQLNSHSLGRLVVSPQAFSEFESKMALA